MKKFEIKYEIVEDFLPSLEEHQKEFNKINFQDLPKTEMQTTFGTKESINQIFINYLNNYFLKHKLEIKNIWAQKYENGKHSAHIHTETDASFVWYVYADENCSKIAFYNPGWPYVITHIFNIQPFTGTLLLFNSSIPHEVLPNGNQTRNVIAGNLKWLK